MNRRFLATLIAVLSLMTCLAGNNAVVWNEPSIDFCSDNGDGENNLALELNEVEFTDSATILYLTTRKIIDFGQSLKFSHNAYLLADDVKYPALMHNDIVFDTFSNGSIGNRHNVALRFKPLPHDVKVFDYIDESKAEAMKILGIRPAAECWDILFPSYWRNNKTGDWEIAFFDDCAVYDCRFWSYKSRDINSKSGEADLVMTNGNDELKVSVGINENGHRNIIIGNQKVNCSMITGHYLPDYPTVDTRTDFVDTGYKPDTVTLAGWLKNVPENFKSNNTVRITTDDLFSNRYLDFRASIDENGRFIARIPVCNSSSFNIRFYMNHSELNTVLEPGKDYFILIDFKDGKRLWMGDDARLQNELFRLPPNPNSMRVICKDLESQILTTEGQLKRHSADVDTICSTHPSLSYRFRNYSKNYPVYDKACDFSRAHLEASDSSSIEEALIYTYDAFWSKDVNPVTLYNNTVKFYKLFFDAYLSKNNKDSSRHIDETIDAPGHNEAQLAIPGQNNRQKEFEYKITATLRYYSDLLNKLNAKPIVKDIILYDYLRTQLDDKSSDLPYIGPEVIVTLSELVKTPEFIKRIEAQNDKNIAVLNGNIDKLLVKTDNPEDVFEGKELLHKILEPFKGKFVLLDVWGTWCGPCLQLLSKSDKVYERLTKHDIAYVYLANNSPEDEWKNKINQYKVYGDNVANYNLPVEQQAAIEKYLNVLFYPSYRLFDRDGNLLDLDVSTRYLDNLDSILELLSDK